MATSSWNLDAVDNPTTRRFGDLLSVEGVLFEPVAISKPESKSTLNATNDNIQVRGKEGISYPRFINLCS